MNPAKAKFDALNSAAGLINTKSRRKIVEDEIRPILVALRSDWNHFALERDVFLRQLNTIEMWATEIWKKKDGEKKVGKFQAELSKLELRMK